MNIDAVFDAQKMGWLVGIPSGVRGVDAAAGAVGPLGRRSRRQRQGGALERE
jgi:hypothetical protein